jgi:threonine dehydrogenase-like Zn-dependent dehydrogenase
VNPAGPLAGTVFYGGPENAGGLDGLQAEYAVTPYAATNLVKLPDEINDDQAIMMSDILPTSYQAAEMARIHPGDTVAVFGCGPVGQMAIMCAQHLGAGRVFAIDQVESRLELAREHGAEIINFAKEDPVEVLREYTLGSGPDSVIDAVGVDATCAHASSARKSQFQQEMKTVAPDARKAEKNNWWIGGAPTQALEWAVTSVAKAGTVSIIGVYPETVQNFPIGKAMNKNLKLNMGNCNHRKYLPRLVELVRSGVMRPEQFFTKKVPIISAIDAYHHFDQHEAGWMKVKLEPGAAAAAA